MPHGYHTFCLQPTQILNVIWPLISWRNQMTQDLHIALSLQFASYRIMLKMAVHPQRLHKKHSIFHVQSAQTHRNKWKWFHAVWRGFSCSALSSAWRHGGDTHTHTHIQPLPSVPEMGALGRPLRKTQWAHVPVRTWYSSIVSIAFVQSFGSAFFNGHKYTDHYTSVNHFL